MFLQHNCRALAANGGRSDWLGRRKGGGLPAPLPPQAGQPSLAAYRDMRRAGRIKPASPVLEEFEAAPWLLPPRTPAFPYAGATDFDELLALRAQPAGNHSSAVAILLFNKNWAAMSQNSSERPGAATAACCLVGLLCAACLPVPARFPSLPTALASPSPAPFLPLLPSQSTLWSSTAACATTWL